MRSQPEAGSRAAPHARAANRRLVLTIGKLGLGGAERAISSMANWWAGEGREVTLVTFDEPATSPAYELHPSVTWRRLDLVTDSRGVAAAVRNNVIRIRRLRREFARLRPSAIVSFVGRVNALVIPAAVGLGIPVIVSERVHPLHHPIGRPWKILRRLLYPLADRVVVQSEAVLSSYGRSVRSRASVIPNFVDIGDAPDGPGGRNAERRAPTVVAMGRLVPQKGFDLLLRAFASIADGFPDWRLVVWGEGPQRAGLEALRDELSLSGRATFPGATRRPHEVMRGAGLFVLSSRYEGFPNVLCEAMAHGLPVIAADCPSGPREIVHDGVDGLLVAPDDAGALADALARLMGDAGERGRLAARATAIRERLAPDVIMARWDGLIDELVALRSTAR